MPPHPAASKADSNILFMSAPFHDAPLTESSRVR
jgi:hypothetical protein